MRHPFSNSAEQAKDVKPESDLGMADRAERMLAELQGIWAGRIAAAFTPSLQALKT